MTRRRCQPPVVDDAPRKLEGKTCRFLMPPADFLDLILCDEPAVVWANGWRCKEHAPKPARKVSDGT